MSGYFGDLLTKLATRRRRDAERWATLAEDDCQLCAAHGPDKRSLFLSCLYDVTEVVPEVIDLFDVPLDQTGLGARGKGFFYLRICKSCRGDLLGRLGEWRSARVALRDRSKDSDGGLMDDDDERDIPVRDNGAVVMMNRAEWEERRMRQGREV